MFFHLAPGDVRGHEGLALMNKIDVPVLELEYSAVVRLGTAAVVILGFGWVVWRLVRVVLVQVALGGGVPVGRDVKGEAMKKEKVQ